MWILDQNKKSVMGFSGEEILLNNKYISVWNDRIATYNHSAYSTPERAAQVFEELLISLAKGDTLFRMPEK